MKTFITTTILCLAIGTGFTQKQKLSPEQKADKQTAKLTKQLKLTDAQLVNVKAEKLAYHKDLARLKDNDQLKAERKAHKEAAKKRREEQKTEILPILTQEQQQKLTEIEAKRKEKRAAKGKKPHKGMRHPKKGGKSTQEIAERKTNRLAKQLDLTPEQKVKVKEVHLKHMNENKAYKAKNKKYANETKKVKESIKTLKVTHVQNIERMLTPDQVVKYKKIQAKKLEKRQTKKQK